MYEFFLVALFIWAGIFHATGKWLRQEIALPVRSMLNIIVIQWVLIEDAADCDQPTTGTLVVVASAVAYNTMDILMIFVNPGWLERYWVFLFHHACVIFGALTPILSASYYSAYKVAAIFEWTSLSYSIAQLARNGVIGLQWMPLERITWHTLYFLFFTSIRLLGSIEFVRILFAEHAIAPLWATITFSTVVIGIAIFSVFASLDIYKYGDLFTDVELS